MLVVEEQLNLGNFTAADQRLSILDERMFEKDPIIKTELEQYHVWYDLRKSMLLEGRDYDQLTVSEKQVLENLALQYYYTTAGKRALAFLDFEDSGWFIPPAYGKGEAFGFRTAILRLLYSSEVKEEESHITIQTDDWSSGSYTYRLFSKDEVFDSNTFEIVR